MKNGMISPGSSPTCPIHGFHSGATSDQGQGRRNRRQRAASADHSIEQPRSAATATATSTAAASASKTEQCKSRHFDLHHIAEREAAPRRDTAQTARPRPARTTGAGVDPGDAAPTAAAAEADAAKQRWRSVLRHPAEGPRGGGEAAHHHPHPRPEQPAPAAANSTE